MAKDGVTADRYPLMRLPITFATGMGQRTRLNVSDSDGTAILYSESLKGGARALRATCARC
jgi:putative molybdenum carrier protein